jgi:nucleoside phosphorylase
MIFFVVALKAEATPIIEFYRLRAYTPKGLFTVYERDNIKLIISGIGKTAAAAAVAYHYAISGQPEHTVWLNIGIAGHREDEIGGLRLAHKITDATTGRSWYPPQVISHTIATANLVTVENPEYDFGQASLYDMEAAGFYKLASRCATAEYVQCLKIISDNAQAPANSTDKLLNAEAVTKLIASQLPAIVDYASAIENLAEQSKAWSLPDDVITPFIQRWKLTVTQQRQLFTLLQRQRALQPETGIGPDEFAQSKTGGQMLASMQARINSLPVKL